MRTLIYIMAFIFASSSYGAQEPNLDDTISWLKTVIQNHSIENDHFRVVRTFRSNCEILLKRTDRDFDSSSKNRSIKLRNVPVHAFDTWLDYEGDAIGVVVSGSGVKDPSGNTTRAKIRLPEEYAERAKKAFQHAAKLCGSTGVNDNLF